MDDEGVHDESLPGRCSQVAGLADALVDLPENSRFEVSFGEEGGREALSGARNRRFRGNHRDMHDRAPRNGPWSRCQANGGIQQPERDDRRLLGRRRRPRRPRRPGHSNVLLSSVDFDPHSAQTLGQIANSLTVCENTVSVAIRADSRTIRNRSRGGRFQAMGGVTAGPGMRLWRGTDRHGAEEVGQPGGGQASAMSVSISRIRPMLVARSALSGIAVEIFRSSSSHPVPSLRTTPALFSRRSFGQGTSTTAMTSPVVSAEVVQEPYTAVRW